MEKDEPPENVGLISRRLRLSLPQGDSNAQQPLLPRANTEAVEVVNTLGKRKTEAMVSAAPWEDHLQFPQERSSRDFLFDGNSRLGVDAAQLRPKRLRLWQRATDDRDDNDEDDQDMSEVNPRSIAEVIYAENRKKARLAHAVFEKFGPKVIKPLYQEPSDTAICHENMKKFQVFKKSLMLHLKRKAQEREGKAGHSSDTSNQLMQARRNGTCQRYSSEEWKAKEQKYRQFFETQFAELKKKRQEQVLLAKAGQRKRRGADMQLILGVQEQDRSEKRRKLNCAVLPPLRTDEQRTLPHGDFESLVEDPMAELKKHQLTKKWNVKEKTIFREKFIEHPKNFGMIASSLDGKSVADCVEYYYNSKRKENYKQLIGK